MGTVLLKALSFVLIIVLGYVLKKLVFKNPKNHQIIAFILLNVTLPATVIHAFGTFRRDTSLFLIILIGFLCAVVPMLFVYLISRHQKKDKRAFSMINVCGFNIGCFALPFVQNFFGPGGMIIACLFDIGNAFMVTGGSFAFTSTVLQTNPDEKQSVGTLLKKFVSSIPFDTYMLMLVLVMLNIPVPDVVITLVEPIASANSFFALLLIGMMFEFRIRADKYRTMFGVLGLRLLFGAAFSAMLYFFLPFSIEIRQVLAVVAFAPVTSLAPIYTERCQSDGALSSLTLSISIVISLTVMIGLVLVMQA